MAEPRRLLYFAENALSAIQGGGIVAYAVLRGLPPDRLLGFYDYRNITPVAEYADRFIYLGPPRPPAVHHAINRVTNGTTREPLARIFSEQYVRADLQVVREYAERRGFEPEVVYFSGLSYRYLRLAVMAAEHYDVPMVVLHMDDWMEVERAAAGPRWGRLWSRRIAEQMTRAAARSLVSTSNSPRLASKLTAITGYRHVAANNCCTDLMPSTGPRAGGQLAPTRRNRIPVITYTGAMNQHLQGETLKVLASAVTELNAEGTRVHLHVYTPWEFAPDANAIAVPHAVFYKGQVGRERLADIYRRSDFLATTVTYRNAHIPLFRHSLSTKLSEYLCAGKPVISMGHHDWHLHEYVQDHGCGFSIQMDEHFSRAAIKGQLRRILSTDPRVLDEMSRRNRALWARAHDVTIMTRQTRQALGIESVSDGTRRPEMRAGRGALWVGGPGTERAGAWVPAAKLTAICRRLVDVFGHDEVDAIGHDVLRHPELDAVLAYCHAIGLRPTVRIDPAGEDHTDGWEPAGTRWSLAIRQRRPEPGFDPPRNLFEQVAEMRGTPDAPAPTPVQRAINQLSIRVSERAGRRPVLWCYGSAGIGLDVIDAVRHHAWLGRAVDIGGFVSSPAHRTGGTLHGHPWRSVGDLAGLAADLIVVTSETSRLAIQEELTRHGLLEKAIAMYGLAAAAATYERVPYGQGQAFVEGAAARDYATSELRARMVDHSAPGREKLLLAS